MQQKLGEQTWEFFPLNLVFVLKASILGLVLSAFSYLVFCCLLPPHELCELAANLSTHPIFLSGQLEEVSL